MSTIQQKAYCTVCNWGARTHVEDPEACSLEHEDYVPHEFDGDPDPRYAHASWVMSEYQSRFDREPDHAKTIMTDLLTDLMAFSQRHDINMGDAYNAALYEYETAPLKQAHNEGSHDGKEDHHCPYCNGADDTGNTWGADD